LTFYFLNRDKVDRFVFFYHAIPPEASAITLEELHTIVRDIWLKRHDHELETEATARRKGRPKSARQILLEEIKLREAEEYRTGLGMRSFSIFYLEYPRRSIEVPDITHAATVKVFRGWNQTGIGSLAKLRFIRINSEDPETAMVSKPGTHEAIVQARTDVDMEDQSAD